jgi:hypothetical protein
MVINKGQNVGIGTTAPGSKLEVNGNVTASSFTATSGLMSVGVTTFSVNGSNPNSVFVGIGTNAQLTDSEENLGIKGDVSTIAFGRGFWQKFHRDGHNEIWVGGGASGRLMFKQSTGAGKLTIGLGGVSMGTYANDEVTPPTDGLIVSGPVGISTSVPSASLVVVGRTGDEYAVRISSAGGEKAFGIHQNGHLSIYGSTASIATCANGAISTLSKRDTALTINFTGANSSCGISFGEPFDNQPVCVCTTKNVGNNGCDMSQVSASSATFVPQSGAWANGDMLNVICLGPH